MRGIKMRIRGRGCVSHRGTEGDGGGGTSPPCTERIFVENRDLIYILARLHIAWLRPERKGKRGTASQFPAQRDVLGTILNNLWKRLRPEGDLHDLAGGFGDKLRGVRRLERADDVAQALTELTLARFIRPVESAVPVTGRPGGPRYTLYVFPI